MIGLNKISKSSNQNPLLKKTSQPVTCSNKSTIPPNQKTITTVKKSPAAAGSAFSQKPLQLNKNMFGMPSSFKTGAMLDLKSLVSEYQELEEGDYCGCPIFETKSKPAKSEPEQPAQTQLTSEMPRLQIADNPQSIIRELEWSAFKGKVPESSRWAAVTIWNHSYSFKPIPSEHADKVRVDVKLKCVLDPKSWVKNKRDDLLRHEQGHFDLACLCMFNFKKKIIEKEFNKKTFKDDVSKIYQEIVREFRRRQIQYDDETAHSRIRDEQERWEKKIMEEMQEMNIYEFMDVNNI